MSIALIEGSNRSQILKFANKEYKKAFSSLFGESGESCLDYLQSEGKSLALEVGKPREGWIDDFNESSLVLPKTWSDLIKGPSDDEDVVINGIILKPNCITLTATILNDESFFSTLGDNTEDEFFSPTWDSEIAVSRRNFMDLPSGMYFLPYKSKNLPWCRQDETTGKDIYRVGVITAPLPDQALLDLPKVVEAVYATPGSRIVIA